LVYTYRDLFAERERELKSSYIYKLDICILDIQIYSFNVETTFANGFVLFILFIYYLYCLNRRPAII